MPDLKTKPVGEDVSAETEAVQRRARLASVRTRNTALDHLHVPNADPNLHYEWVHNDYVSRVKKENLGFHVVKDNVTMNYQSSSGENVAGDVVLMACTQENYKDIEFIDHQEYLRRHGSVKDGELTAQGEEKEFDGRAASAGLSIVEESTTKSVTGAEVKAILNSQT